MFDNLKSEVKNGFKPLLNIVDIQSNTAQKIAREQLDFMSECLSVSSRQVETLRGNRSAETFLRVPVDTGRELSERWVSTASRQWSILREARDALTGEVRSAAKDIGSNVKQAAAKAEAAAQDEESNVTQAYSSNSNAKTRKTDTAA